MFNNNFKNILPKNQLLTFIKKDLQYSDHLTIFNHNSSTFIALIW